MLDRIKQSQAAIQVAWLTGKILNHRIPGFVSRTATGEPRTALLSTPDSTPGTEQGSVSEFDTQQFRSSIHPTPNCPILTSDDVTDFGAVDFVADPFLFPGEDKWYLFFEIFNDDRDPDAVIGLATSPDGYEWNYEGVVLQTEKHLSFPYLFEWDGERYMLPETGGEGDTMVELYKASDFPIAWNRCAIPVSGTHDTDDAVIFRWNGRWWLVVGDATISGVHLYYSELIERDGWHSHPDNPVVTNRSIAYRPAGRPVVTQDRIVLFYQDCANRYGEHVRAYEITRLDPTGFADNELDGSPVLEGEKTRIGWNSGRMHHIDPWYFDGQWLCAVDGNIQNSKLFTNNHWSIGIYTSDQL